MVVIHYPTAYKALDSFIDKYNKQINKLADRLRSSSVLVAKELIRIYGVALLKSESFQQCQRDLLPALKTNNQQLAGLVKCSSRTIQRQLQKLIKAGIITHKVWHGSNSGYELWLNPEILQVKEKPSKEYVQNELKKSLGNEIERNQSAEEIQLSPPICLHTYSSNKRYINSLIAVENVNNTATEKKDRRSLPLTDNANTGYSAGNSAGNTGEIGMQVGQAGYKVAPAATCTISYELQIGLFWIMARNLLYADVDLTDRQVEIAKALIRKLYAPVTEQNLWRVHQMYIERLAMVDRFIRKDPENRFVPLPTKYFDTNNPNGFVGTRTWYLAHLKRKKEVERELLLSRQIRKFIRNKAQDTSRKRPDLKVFRECETALGKLHDPAIMARFHAAVLQPETFQQLSINHQKQITWQKQSITHRF